MRPEDTARLNAFAVGRRIEAAGLRQWWIAEQIGVDRKTVARWLSGKTRRIARENLERLARILDASPSDLVVSDEADIAATREEQRTAADLAAEQDLLQLLSPTDSFKLAESLIRATLAPNLPLQQLGRLYNMLATAAWRQGHYEDGRARAERALEIGKQVRDRAISLRALHSLAVIESLTGRVDRAVDTFRVCASEPEAFDTPRAHAGALSNLAMLYGSLEQFEDSIATQLEAIAIFESLGASYNLSIAFTGLGAVYTEIGRLCHARDAFERGRDAAAQCGYTRGVDCAEIYLADVASLSGARIDALERVSFALPSLSRYAVYDLGCHECAARVMRRAAHLDEAGAELARGIAQAHGFPEIRGRMLQEQARLAQARADARAARASLEAAGRAFREAGLSVRERSGPLAEYGSQSECGQPSECGYASESG